jgi:hypothetical protein
LTSKGYDLSGQMGSAFSYALKLIMRRPGATLRDLRELLQETPKGSTRDDQTTRYLQSAFKDDILKLSEDTQNFYKHHFFADGLVATRASIARRIHSLLDIPAFRRMFTATTNTLDLFTEMNDPRGSVILVNTNVDLLKMDGMVLFGRYIIARILEAAYQRTKIPEQQRKQTYLIIDESAPYFDESFEEILTRIRQYRLGFVMAFQYFRQANDALQHALTACTRIKFAGGLNVPDRRRLAEEMETTPDLLGALRKDDDTPPKKPYWSQFACYVRPNFTTACIQTVDFYQLENMPTMTAAVHQQLLIANKKRLSPSKDSNPPETHNAPVKEALRGIAIVPAEPTSSEKVSIPAKPEQSKKPDPSRGIEINVTRRAPQATPNVPGEIEPNEPSSDWKP